MTETRPIIRKLLVAFDPAKPDVGAGDFLIPVQEEDRLCFFGLRSKRLSDLGRTVFLGREVTVNDVFAKLVDSGRKIASVDQTVRMLADYLRMLQEHKIGNVIAIRAVAGEPSGFRLVKVANTPSGVIEVNRWHLMYLLSDLGYDPRPPKPVPADQNDKAEMQEFLRLCLLPIHRERPPGIEKKVKDSLRYFLTTRSVEDPFGGLQDLPIDIPDDPYVLLEWLWEVLYPGEDFHVTNVQQFVERNDMMAANEVCTPGGGWQR